MGVDTRFAKSTRVVARCSPVCSRDFGIIAKTSVQVIGFYNLLLNFVFSREIWWRGRNQAFTRHFVRFLALLGVILRFLAFSRPSTRCLRFLCVLTVLRVYICCFCKWARLTQLFVGFYVLSRNFVAQAITSMHKACRAFLCDSLDCFPFPCVFHRFDALLDISSRCGVSECFRLAGSFATGAWLSLFHGEGLQQGVGRGTGSTEEGRQWHLGHAGRALGIRQQAPGTREIVVHRGHWDTQVALGTSGALGTLVAPMGTRGTSGTQGRHRARKKRSCRVRQGDLRRAPWPRNTLVTKASLESLLHRPTMSTTIVRNCGFYFRRELLLARTFFINGRWNWPFEASCLRKMCAID